MFRTFCCENERLSIECKGRIKRSHGVGNIVIIVQRRLRSAAHKVSCWELKSPIENHASVSLAAVLSFFQGHLCAHQKCAFLHMHHALSLCHKTHTTLQIPNRGSHSDIGCRDSPQCQGQTVALTTVHATVLSLVSPANHILASFISWVWFYTRGELKSLQRSR